MFDRKGLAARLRGSLRNPNYLPRTTKRAILVLVDLIIMPFALWSAFALRLGDPFAYVPGTWWLFAAAPLIAIPIFVRLGLYHAVVRFMGPQVVLAVAKGVTLSTLILAVLVLFSGLSGVPRSVFLIYWGAAMLYIGGSRFLMRNYVNNRIRTGHIAQRVVIYGAGAAGVQLASLLSHGYEYEPVAFIDDSPSHKGSIINGLRVHPPEKLGTLVDEMGVDQVLLAMPSASRGRRRAIVEELEPLLVHVKTVPSINDLVSGRANVDEIKDIEIEDLLGRDSVAPEPDLLDACIKDKAVMVTGAGGSIGSELCRQIVMLRPKRLVLFELSEYNLYSIERELRGVLANRRIDVEMIPLLGSVCDRERLQAAMKRYRIDTVYHAAAYKHVPLVEYNCAEGVRNNVFGTLHSAEAARNCGVGTFVLISTDKAVRPTNVMGASKRLGELVLQGLSLDGPAHQAGTRFCMVRFGNVLGSSGSVVPLFREQIRHGGPVTVTHPEIIRYFMTIPEAAQLVLQAGSMGTGGDVFVLDMGEPVRIADLARRMIRLMGFEVADENHPEGDIAIEFTGLRPGEKLYEELLIGDNVAGTQHPRILRAEEVARPWSELAVHLDRLERACDEGDAAAIRSVLLEVVNGYQPNGRIEDLVWEEEPGRQVAKVVPLPGQPAGRAS